MKTPITSKNLGIDDLTGLEMILEIYRIDINSDVETISVEYRINYLAPKNQEIIKSITSGFHRFNKPATLDEKGTEIKAANFKFDQLRDSPVGKGIVAMLQMDLDSFPNVTQD